MPNYDLRCAHCKTEFRIMASMEDRTQRRIPCPDCGSCDVEAVFKSLAFQIKGNSAPECPHGAACGRACPHAAGY